MNKSTDSIPVITNHRAGAMHEASGDDMLTRMAREAGFAIHILKSHSPEEMGRLLDELVKRNEPRVGVAGGDGTVEAAVQHLAHTKTALGILSQGTFNNFATCVRLPHNLPAALKTLHEGTPRAFDLGRVRERLFTESAGIGLFADGLSLYGQGTNKNMLRGLYTALRMAFSFRARQMTLTIDGEEQEEAFILCEVANTYRIAQAVPIAPEAEINDGKLDVVTIGNIKRGEVLPYLRALRAQMHVDLPQVKIRRAQKEVRLQTPRPRNVHADDQVVGQTPVTITIEPGALLVMVDENR